MKYHAEHVKVASEFKPYKEHFAKQEKDHVLAMKSLSRNLSMAKHSILAVSSPTSRASSNPASAGDEKEQSQSIPNRQASADSTAEFFDAEEQDFIDSDPIVELTDAEHESALNLIIHA